MLQENDEQLYSNWAVFRRCGATTLIRVFQGTPWSPGIQSATGRLPMHLSISRGGTRRLCILTTGKIRCKCITLHTNLFLADPNPAETSNLQLATFLPFTCRTGGDVRRTQPNRCETRNRDTVPSSLEVRLHFLRRTSRRRPGCKWASWCCHRRARTRRLSRSCCRSCGSRSTAWCIVAGEPRPRYPLRNEMLDFN